MLKPQVKMKEAIEMVKNMDISVIKQEIQYAAFFKPMTTNCLLYPVELSFTNAVMNPTGVKRIEKPIKKVLAN